MAGVNIFISVISLLAVGNTYKNNHCINYCPTERTYSDYYTKERKRSLLIPGNYSPCWALTALCGGRMVLYVVTLILHENSIA